MSAIKKILRILGYLLAGIIVLVVATVIVVRVNREDIVQYKKEKFNKLSEGTHEYIIAGYHFMIPGKYLSHNFRRRPGKVAGILLEAEMPDMRPWKPDPDYRVNNTNVDRVSFDLQIRHGSEKPFKEYVPIGYEKNTRQVLPNGWIRYDSENKSSDQDFFYLKDLGTPIASFMYCDLPGTIPNPGCQVFTNFNDRIRMGISFRLSRWQDWEEIEAKLRSKTNEFMIK